MKLEKIMYKYKKYFHSTNGDIKISKRQVSLVRGVFTGEILKSCMEDIYESDEDNVFLTSSMNKMRNVLHNNVKTENIFKAI